MSGSPAVNKNIYKTVGCSSIGMTKKAVISSSMFAMPSLIILDGFAIVFSLAVAYLIRSYILPLALPGFFKPGLIDNTLQNLWWLPLVFIFCMAYEELYQKRAPFWKEVEATLKACFMAMFFSISLLYMAKLSGGMSRTLVLITWLCTAFLIPLFRYAGKLLLIKMHIWERPVIILGAGKTGRLMLDALTREKVMGYTIVGFLDDNREIKEVAGAKSNIVRRVIGTFDDAERIISVGRVQEVIIAAPGIPSSQLVELTNRLQQSVKNVMVVPDLFGLSMNGIEVEYFFDEQALLLNVKNKLRSPLNRAIKRIFDIITGMATLLLLIPVMLLIAIAIIIDSRGPAFFTQERIGQNGNLFTCFKFRTMHLKGDKILTKYLKKNRQAKKEWHIYNKLREYDPRLTRMGAVLRRFSLDELPQLINVIAGDMSLVGPRPYLQREKMQMGSSYHDILVAKPGITGLWQVSGRNEIDFEGRLKLDVWYVRNWSLWMDIIFLVKTLRVVLKREGAY